MDSNPIGATSRWKASINTARIVINLFLGPKMRSSTELSNIEVMFSDHGDCVWATLPPGTSSVGFEQYFVADVMQFRLADAKIVIKSIFSILTIFKKNNKPHIFTPPLPNGRGGVKIWGLLFFYMIYEYSPVTKTIIFSRVWSNFSTAMWKIENRLDRKLCFSVLNKLLQWCLQDLLLWLAENESSETSYNDAWKLMST